MIYFLVSICGCRQEFSPLQIEKTFSPTVLEAIDRLEWRYHHNCMGVEAYWYTHLPKGTAVQLVTGPKIDGSHFDEDAHQDQQTQIDDQGRAILSKPSSTRFSVEPSMD